MMTRVHLMDPAGQTFWNTSSPYVTDMNITDAVGAGNINNNHHYHNSNTHQQDLCDGVHCYHHGVLDTATVATVALAVFGAVGNILTVLAILTSRLRNNINSILICNLSLADVVYCGIVLPLQAMAFYHRSWTLGATLCELHAALRIWLIGVNLLLLSFIALYRFLHVVQPQNHTRFSQGFWFVGAVIICWAVPFVFSFTPVVDWWGAFAFQERILQCTFSPAGSKWHKISVVTLGYVVPSLFLCVCYARIGCVVYRSRTRTSRGGSLYRKQRARRESFRLTGMMVLIFLGFLVGTTPYFLINTLDSKLRYPMPHIWSPFLAWFMYGLNPIIYTVMDAQFQRAYRRLLLCKILQPDTAVETTAQQERQNSLLCKSEIYGEGHTKSTKNSSPTKI